MKIKRFDEINESNYSRAGLNSHVGLDISAFRELRVIKVRIASNNILKDGEKIAKLVPETRPTGRWVVNEYEGQELNRDKKVFDTKEEVMEWLSERVS